MKQQKDRRGKMSEKAEVDELIRNHFDPIFYVEEYDDLGITSDRALHHFVERGWLECRSINSRIDTWNLLEKSREEKDPFAFFMRSLTDQATTGNQNASNFLLSSKIIDYRASARDAIYAIIRLTMDQKYYVSTFLANCNDQAGSVNLAHHFMAGACRDGHRPYREVRKAIDRLDKTELHRLSLLVRQASAQTTIYEQLHEFIKELEACIAAKTSPKKESTDLFLSDLTDDQKFLLSKISESIDKEFYLLEYPEIELSQADPAYHYAFSGWKEGKNPTRDFDTNYYLQSYSDVREALVNPFYHFIVAGASEGRIPKRPTSLKRRMIEDQIPVRDRSYGGPDVSAERKLSVQSLTNLLSEAGKGAEGIVLSISHDCYLRSIGGTQIFIADEAKGFARNKISYLHISPTKFNPYLAQGGTDYLIQVVLNDVYLGIISMNRFRDALKSIELPGRRPAAMVHVMLGHDPDLIIGLLEAFKAEAVYIWLHDYSTICTGFHLLRNDVEFCGGPKQTSMSCRVCIHGAERSEHIKQVRDFFSAIKPIAIAPSERAAELWWDMKVVECDTVLIVPHVELVFEKEQRSARSTPGNGWDPIRVAFVGYPSYHKGWPLFEKLLDQYGLDPRFEFYHFASPGSSTARMDVKFITLEVSNASRFAAVEALTNADIDIAVNASPWPETFSYVAYETCASGALTYTLTSSGNVAAMVRETQGGEVFENEEQLIASFANGLVTEQVQARARAGKKRAKLVVCGTTAAVIECENKI